MIIQRQLFRVEPNGRPEDYKTYSLKRPIKTHWREATCQEVDCPNYVNGWRQVIDVSTDLGRRQARYIRDHSGRKYVVVSQVELIITLEFPAGQRCFSEHRKPLEREPLFFVKGGDYRGNPRNIPTVQRKAADWVDDFGSHQIRLTEQLKKG